jgi:hypothetical protein
MFRKFFAIQVAFIAIACLLFNQPSQADEPIDIQDFITALNDVMTNISKDKQGIPGIIQEVEMHISAIYKKDQTGNVRIFVVPYDANFTSPTVHKLILRWRPKHLPQGNVSFPSALLPLMMQQSSSAHGLTPEQQQKLRELLPKMPEKKPEDKQQNEQQK